MMKLTPAQKRLLLDTYTDKELHGCQTKVSSTYKPAVFLVEHGLASWGEGKGIYKPLVLTEEGNTLAFSMIIP